LYTRAPGPPIAINARVRLAAENDRLHEACALLREELRIKDTRVAQIAPQRRPHYGPHERMAILELRAARGWSLKQTADTFLVTPATIAAWVKRIDDQGANPVWSKYSCGFPFIIFQQPTQAFFTAD